jgi:archaeoflavoprotein AfpA
MKENGEIIKKKLKIAWGITGSGDRLEEIVDVMKKAKNSYQHAVDVRVYLSKAGEQVTKWYKLFDGLKQNFDKLYVEAGPNSPFLAGDLQLGKFKFLLLAPATSNTVAKIASGIADSLLSNSAIMALKGFTPVYVLPSDYREGTVETKLPDGRRLKVRVRKEDAENSQRLADMNGLSVIENPEQILEVFKKHFDQEKS